MNEAEERLRDIIAAAYQWVGSLSSEIPGAFEHETTQLMLDILADPDCWVARHNEPPACPLFVK